MKRIKYDLILIASVLIIASVFLVIFKHNQRKTDLKALVYYKESLILEIDLSKLSEEGKEYIIEGENGEIVIEAKHNAIRVEKENSPYHICSKQGFVSTTNEPIICLPNKVYIKIVDSSSNMIDVEM